MTEYLYTGRRKRKFEEKEEEGVNRNEEAQITPSLIGMNDEFVDMIARKRRRRRRRRKEEDEAQKEGVRIGETQRDDSST